MSYTYLQEQGEESSADNFLAIPASVLSRLNLTVAASCSNASGTDACLGSQSGTTCEHSTGDRGEDLLTLCAVGSHARTFQQPDAAKASPASGLACGEKWPASLAKYDRDSCSWRTHQFSLAGGLELFLATWPRWGLMRGGECWERTMPGLPTFVSGSGFWRSPAARESGVSVERLETRTGDPVGSSCRHYDKMTGRMAQIGLTQQVNAMRLPTPRKSDSERGGRGDLIQAVRGNPNSHYTMFPTPTARDRETDAPNRTGGPILGVAVRMLPTPGAADNRDRGNMTMPSIQRRAAMGKQLNLSMVVSDNGGALNPPWVEWLMGWPIGWTDLQPLETGKYQAWRHSHGEL